MILIGEKNAVISDQYFFNLLSVILGTHPWPLSVYIQRRKSRDGVMVNTLAQIARGPWFDFRLWSDRFLYVSFICLYIDIELSQPYWKSTIDGQISAHCQSTFKMGQSVTLKSQSLLHILYLGHIRDTLGRFIGLI